MADQDYTDSVQIAGFCDCVEPQPFGDWIPIGLPGNVVDYAVCDYCGCPIQGSQVAHQEPDRED